MRRFLNTGLIFFLAFGSVFAQYEVPWSRSIGNIAGSSAVQQIRPYTDHQVIVAGWFNVPFLDLDTFRLQHRGSEDVFVAITDANGNYQSALSIGGEGNEYLSAVAHDRFGNLFVAVSFESLLLHIGDTTLLNQGSYDPLLVKYNALGQPIWIWHPGTVDFEQITDMRVDETGNVYLTFQVITEEMQLNGSSEVQFIKLSPDGAILWTQTIKGEAVEEMQTGVGGMRIFMDDETILLVGLASGVVSIGDDEVLSVPEQAAVMIRFDEQGSWEQAIFWEEIFLFSDLTFQGDQIYAVGQTISTEYSELAEDSVSVWDLTWFVFDRDLVLLKTVPVRMAALDPLFSAYSFGNQPGSIHVSESGRVYLTGAYASAGMIVGNDTLPLSTGNFLIPYSNVYLLEFDINGNEIGASAFATDLRNDMASTVLLPDNTLVIGGLFQQDTIRFGNQFLVNSAPLQNAFTPHWAPPYQFRRPLGFLAAIKFNSTTSISQSQKLESFLYPNPSQDHFYLHSEAFGENPVQVQIFSTDGKLLNQQQVLPNGNSLRVETAALPPGVYFVCTMTKSGMQASRFVKQ